MTKRIDRLMAQRLGAEWQALSRAQRQRAADDFTAALMLQRFGPEWEALTTKQRALVANDFAEMLLEEYDTPDNTMDDFTIEENAHAASIRYRRRIGGSNLAAYVKSLEARKDR